MAAALAHLQPPGSYSGTPQSPVEMASPASSSANVAIPQVLLERSEIDKSLKSLESLLSLLYDYAQLWQSLVGLDKKLVKAFRDAGSMKRSNSTTDGLEWPTSIFSTSSLIFEGVSEVDSKYSKLVEREYESCNQDLKKWLKKMKKEDKALDEYTTAANAKIKAAGLAYEKKSKKGISSSPSGPSLDSYSALLSTLSSSVANAKHQHSLFSSSRHITTLYSISGSVGRITDAQWMKTCDLLRRCAPNVGPLGEARSYVEGGWRGGLVQDLPLNLPVDPNRDGALSPAMDTMVSRDTTMTRPRLPTAASSMTESLLPIQEPQGEWGRLGGTSPRPETSSNPPSNVLERVKEELALSMAIPGPKTKPDAALGDLSKGAFDTVKSAKPSTDVKAETVSKEAEDRTAKAENVRLPAKPNANDVTTTDSTGTTRSTGTDKSGASSSNNAQNTGSLSSEPKEKEEDKAEWKPKMPTLANTTESAVFEPRNTLARTPNSLPAKETTPGSPDIPSMPDPRNYFTPHETQQATPTRPSPTPIYSARTTSQPQSPAQPNASSASPNLPQAPVSYAGRAVSRTLSIDSTNSNNSLVAAMRDRYSAASPPPPPPLHPTGRRADSYAPRSSRDGNFSPREREGGKVSDMASRFTPIEGPLPPLGGDSRYGRPRERNDGPPVTDTLPIRTPLRRTSMDEFGASFDAASNAASGRRGMDTMPMPDRRQTMNLATDSPRGGGGEGSAIATYDLHMSELELRHKEMELEIHRQRLQLTREREAMAARERTQGYQQSPGVGDYLTSRDTRGYGQYGGGREVAYDSPSGRDAYSSPYGADYGGQSPYGNPQGTPKLGSRADPRSYQDMSTGLGVLGLGLPPGAAAASMSSLSRESLPLRGSDATSNLAAPAPASSSTPRSARGVSPRRSAELNDKEKEKGSTWLGKGLKRFSMPLGS